MLSVIGIDDTRKITDKWKSQSLALLSVERRVKLGLPCTAVWADHKAFSMPLTIL